MASPPPIRIAGKPVYGSQPQSPPLAAGFFGLEYSALPALDESDRETVALFAAGRLPGRYVDIYGSRLEGATKIVALSRETGQVYQRDGEPGHMIPLSGAMNPSPPPPAPGEGRFDSSDLYFALDLRTHLGLPPQAGRYTVFLWLDELSSPVRTVRLPGEPPGPPALPPSAPLPYTLTGPPPQAPGGEIVLEQRTGTVVAVGLGAALRSAKPDSGAKDCLTVLGLDFRSRALRWQSYSFPASVPAFDFDAEALFSGPGWLDAPDPPRRAFLRVAARGALSPVLALTVG